MKCIRGVGLAVILLLVGAYGCGSDGESGDAHVAVDWIGAPNYYNDSNPAIPTLFYRGTYYSAVVGTFSFVYEAWDGSYWSGSYTITVEAGEDGGFFPWDDGEDGADSYFTLWLLSTGPYVESSLDVVPIHGESGTDTFQKLGAVDVASGKQSMPDAKHGVSEAISGGYRITIEYEGHAADAKSPDQH